MTDKAPFEMPAERPLIDIVVPTYNQSILTEACAKSIKRHTEPGLARMVWVDNGSEPAERQAIAAAWEQAGFETISLLLPHNLGFVKATNAGIAVSTAPYVLLLNNDTELPPHWAEKLIDIMVHYPKVGLVGPRSTSKNQWQGLICPEPGAVLLTATDGAQSMIAFFCALIRRAVIEKVGYLSEEYRQGLCDDDDYCQRVRRSGWGIAVRTDLTVVHHHRTTFKAIYGDGGWADYQAENTRYFRNKWGLR